MGWEAPWHWVVLAIIVIALFGYKKLPDAARSLGRSMRIFKTEIKGMGEDDAAREASKSKPAATTPAAPPAIEPAPTAQAGNTGSADSAAMVNTDKPAANGQ
jgi:sec-independent protein translocase protein TatA